MITTIIALICVAYVSAQRQTFVNAVCASLPITTLRQSTNIADVITAGPTVISEAYSVTNAPIQFETKIPRFITSTIDPISGKIFIIFSFNSIQSVTLYLGTLDSETLLITIINPTNPLTVHTFTSMAFDCNGILYAIDCETRKIYTINTINSNIKLFDNSNRIGCGENVDCFELIAYNWDNHFIYRISSQTGQNYVLFVHYTNAYGTGYAITDADSYCTTGIITAMEYIGNAYFLISCSGYKAGIYLLDTSVITAPEIIDISGDIGMTAVGIIPTDTVGNMCVAYCAQQESGSDSSDDVPMRVLSSSDENDYDLEESFENKLEQQNGVDIVKDYAEDHESVLFGDGEIVHNEVGTSDDKFSLELIIWLISSWICFVVVLIINVSIFCYYFRNEKRRILRENGLIIDQKL